MGERREADCMRAASGAKRAKHIHLPLRHKESVRTHARRRRGILSRTHATPTPPPLRKELVTRTRVTRIREARQLSRLVGSLALARARARVVHMQEAIIIHCTNLSEATHSPLVIPFGVVIPEVGWSSIFTARPQCDHQTIHTASVSIVCVSLSLSILLFLIPFSLFPLRSRAVLSLFLFFFPSFFLSFTIAIFPSFFRRYISASCR